MKDTTKFDIRKLNRPSKQLLAMADLMNNALNDNWTEEEIKGQILDLEYFVKKLKLAAGIE
jgi:hypothetical protein